MEDDTELKDLLVQTLEAKGCLAKLRAQLRASVFLALDDDDSMTRRGSMLNPKIQAYTETPEGKAMFCIVREFLQFFGLDFTISVYEPESYMGTSYKYDGRLSIIKDLGLTQLDENCQDPLLLQLIRLLLPNNNNNAISKSGLEPSLSENNTSRSDVSNDNSIRTEISNATESNISFSESVQENKKQEFVNSACLNATFNVSNPKIVSSTDKIEKVTTQEDASNETNNTDDCNTDNKSLELNKRSPDLDKTSNESLELGAHKQSSSESTNDLELSMPVLKESKVASQRSDRLKTKSSSVAELPSSPIGRNRSIDPLILPSLYSHEFKEKTNLKELDGLSEPELDSLDNYEEDFMTTSEIEPPPDLNEASGSCNETECVISEVLANKSENTVVTNST